MCFLRWLIKLISGGEYQWNLFFSHSLSATSEALNSVEREYGCLWELLASALMYQCQVWQKQLRSVACATEIRFKYQSKIGTDPFHHLVRSFINFVVYRRTDMSGNFKTVEPCKVWTGDHDAACSKLAIFDLNFKTFKPLKMKLFWHLITVN